jgi:hypothetical protein
MLVAEVGPGRVGYVKAAVEVHLQDGVEVVFGQLVEGAVAQDAGVVHHAVDGAEFLDRGRHDFGSTVGAGHRGVAGDGLAAGGADLIDHLIGAAGARPGPVAGPTEVVDDDERAVVGEEPCVGAPQPSSGTGDDDDLVLNSGHDRAFPRDHVSSLNLV